MEPTRIEGMVPLRDLSDDFYEFDEKTFSVYGKSTGRHFTLGDKVKVKVVRASLEQKTIDLQLIIPEGEENENSGIFAEEEPKKKKKTSKKK